MLSILPTSDLSLSLLPYLIERRQTLRTKLERLYLSKTGQASSSLLFYSTQWMEIRIRNHSGLNGRASALAPTPVICLPVSSGHFYQIFKEWDHDNELSVTFTVDYFHRRSARADHYFFLWYYGCMKSVLCRFWLLLLRSHSWTTIPTSSRNISAAKYGLHLRHRFLAPLWTE